MPNVRPEDLLVTSFTISGKFVSRTSRGGDTFLSMTISPVEPIPLSNMVHAHTIASKNLYKRLITDAIAKGHVSKSDGFNELRLVLNNIDSLIGNTQSEKANTDET